MRLLLALSLALSLSACKTRGATGLSSAILTNFYTNHFIIDPTAPPTQIIKLRNPNTSTNTGDSLWRTNADGLYLPSITNTPTIVVGQSAEAWFAPSANDGLVSVHDVSAGDSLFNALMVASIDHLLQEDYSYLRGIVGSGASVAANLQLLSATNWQNPAAPVSKFEVGLEPRFGMAGIQLLNNGIMDFSVSNQVTTVMGLQFVPLDAAPLALGPNAINVQSNSYVRLVAPGPDPSLTEINLTTALHDGTALILQNDGAPNGFTLFNGSALVDDPTKWVTLPGGTWASTNSGDGMLLIYGPQGWREVGRFTSNTNTQTGDSLWELVGGHMRTTPATPTDWQFLYNGAPAITLTRGATATTEDIVSPNGTYAVQAGVTDSGTGSYGSTNTVLDIFGGNVSLTLSNGWQFTYGGVPQLTVDTNGDVATAGFDLLTDGYLHVHGTGGYSELQLDGADNGNQLDLYMDDSTSYIHMQSALNNVMRTLVLEPTQAENTPGSSSPFWFGSTTVYTNNPIFALYNGTNGTVLQSPILSFGPDERITFGVGTTNALYRSGGAIVVAGNIGAELSVGDTDFVNMFQASATNALAGALTFLSATNGMDRVEFTHVRYIFNNTGSDQTITLPALWANTMGASIVCTNQKKLRLYVTAVGPTDTAANQTNVWSSVQYAP